MHWTYLIGDNIWTGVIRMISFIDTERHVHDIFVVNNYLFRN